MEITALTQEEISIIQRHRSENDRLRDRAAFQSKVITTAHAWVEWSNDTGQGLTFSTFVNAFGYQDLDGRRMFEAVQSVLDAALQA